MSAGDPGTARRGAAPAPSCASSGGAGPRGGAGARPGAAEAHRAFAGTALLQVALFGAGPVGRALAQVLGVLPCALLWIDDDAARVPGSVADGVELRAVPRPELEVSSLAAGTLCVVATHSHALDRRICTRLLGRDDLPYAGVVGSARKRAAFEAYWRRRGMAPERIARLVCPVGIDTVRGRDPGVIAVAVAAQLLQVHRRLAVRAP